MQKSTNVIVWCFKSFTKLLFYHNSLYKLMLLIVRTIKISLKNEIILLFRTIKISWNIANTLNICTDHRHVHRVYFSLRGAHSGAPTPIAYGVPRRASLSRAFLRAAAIRVSVRRQPRTITDNRSVGRSRYFATHSESMVHSRYGRSRGNVMIARACQWSGDPTKSIGDAVSDLRISVIDTCVGVRNDR